MQINRTLRITAIVGLFILPFLPFVVADGTTFPAMFFPFITGKNFLFRIIVEVIAASWLILALRDHRYMPKKSWVAWAIAAFLGIMAIADILSVNAFKSFWSNFERMEGFISLIHFAALFLVAGTILNTEKLWERLINTTLGASVLMSLYGFAQMIGWFEIHQGSTRIDGTIGNSSYLAAYAIFHLFLALFLFVKYFKKESISRKDGWRLPAFYGIIAILNGIILYSTATRGAMIGTAVGIIFISACLAFFENKKSVLRKAGLGLLVVVVVVLGALFAGHNTAFVKDSHVLSRFSGLIEQASTFSVKALCEGEAKSRCLIWPMAWEGIKERPVFGWGQESFNYLFYKYYDPGMYAQEPWFDRAHNVFLDWAVAGGLLGLLAYLSIFAAAFWYLWKGSPSEEALSLAERAVLSALLIAYFIHNIFVFDQLVSYMMFFLVLAYIHHRYNQPLSAKTSSFLKKNQESLEKVGVPVVAVLAVAALIYFNWAGMVQARTLAYAPGNHPEGPAKNLELFEKAVSIRRMGLYESREQLTQIAAQVSGLNMDVSMKAKFYNLAYAQLKAQIEETPNDVRYLYFLSAFLTQYQQHAEAKGYLEKAVELSPKKQRILFDLAGNHIILGDVKKALEIYRYAYELDPSYDEARINYGLGAVYAKDEALQKAILEPMFGTIIIPDNRFIRAYVTSGYPQRAVQALLGEIERQPSNIQIRIQLASVYFQMKNKSAAIAQIQKAIEIDPTFESQGRAYIEEVRNSN